MPGGRVTLNSSSGHQLTMILNKEPDRTGGVGGWESVDRALRRPAKWWKASPDDTMSLDCTIDIDAIGGPSIERRLRVLRDMGLPQDDEPPTIRMIGDVWDSDQNVNWVMDGLTFGPRLFQGDGTLRRQQVTVELSRFEDVNEIVPLKVTRTRTKGKKPKRKTRTVTARRGETLRGLSLRALGTPSRWKDLQKWNKKLKKIDPDLALRAGTHVKIRG